MNTKMKSVNIFFFPKENQSLSLDTWEEEGIKVGEEEKSGEKSVVVFKLSEERLLGMCKLCQGIK